MTDHAQESRTRRLSERVTMVEAPNPSPMTLEGTNTYVVGGSNHVIVVDPGPNVPEHLDNIVAAAGDAEIVGVFLTHWHADHSAGVRAFAD
ncbi:MAG TPA: MBL fold metallo-hydrolase, partial [Actinomycetota bacterium]|nr:MBL fold metallo-hydrolase [Actinomycetota bacterium]